MEKSNFDQLLQRYLDGQTTEQERIKIEAWLDVMKSRNASDLEMSKKDEEKLFEKIKSRLDSTTAVAAFRPARSGITTGQRVFRIAAAVVILLSASYLIWLFGNTPPRIQPAAHNSVEKMILNDGTLVWLRGQSKLIYFEKSEDGTRHAELSGEALFEVAKDPAHPFIISCGEVNIKVIGTSFSVKTGNDSLELIVLTGKVNLSSASDTIGIDVEPNQKVIFKTNGTMVNLTMDGNDVSTVTANTEYIMQFANTATEEILSKIEGKFNVSVNLMDKQAGKCRITADFTDHSLESTLQMISEILDVEYKIDGSTITVTGQGCN